MLPLDPQPQAGSLIKYRSKFFWLIPYEEANIYVPLTREAVIQKLATKVRSGLVLRTTFLWTIEYRYKVYLKDNFVRIIGPRANRQWCFVTQGDIQDYSGGAVLRLSLRLATDQIIFTVLTLGIYVAAVLFWLQFPLNFLPILLFQVLFIYAAIVGGFKYGANKILNLIEQTITSDI
jgi:hypothetical protein